MEQKHRNLTPLNSQDGSELVDNLKLSVDVRDLSFAVIHADFPLGDGVPFIGSGSPYLGLKFLDPTYHLLVSSSPKPT